MIRFEQRSVTRELRIIVDFPEDEEREAYTPWDGAVPYVPNEVEVTATDRNGTERLEVVIAGPRSPLAPAWSKRHTTLWPTDGDLMEQIGGLSPSARVEVEERLAAWRAER